MLQSINRGLTLRLRWLSSWRYFMLHPAQLLLAVLGVSVGVAAVVAVGAAQQAVEQSYQQDLQLLEGNATHSITASEGLISIQDFRQLRNANPTLAMAPMIRERVRLQDPSNIENGDTQTGRSITVLGMDVFSESSLNTSMAPISAAMGTAESFDIAAWFGGEPHALVSAELATKDALVLHWRGDDIALAVSGILPDAQTTAENLVVIDISLASRLFRREGIDQLRLQLDSKQVEQIEKQLPKHLVLRENTNNTSGLGAAFGLNLLAMGLLALLMGVLIVFSTFRLLLLQRDALTRLRHALGSSPWAQVFDATSEALMLGILGTILGLLGGVGLAYLIVNWLQRTLADLWVSGFVTHITVTPTMVMHACLAGIGGALLAVSPLLLGLFKSGYLTRDEYSFSPRWIVVTGGGLLLLAVVLLKLGDSLILAFAGLFTMTIGYLLLSVPVLGWLALLLRRCFSWQQLLWVLAARRLQASLRHTGPALVALILAVASIIGISSMISSFRGSVSDWMDITLSAPAYVGAQGEPIPNELISTINDWPEIDAVGWLHTTPLQLPGYAAELSIIDLPSQARNSYRMLEGQDIWQTDSQDSLSVMVGETLAARRDITVGHVVSFEVPSLQLSLSAKVVGVFQDYRAGAGRVVIRREHLPRSPSAPTALGLYFDQHLMVDIQKRLEALPIDTIELDMLSSVRIKTETLRIFDQTFLLTSSLRWIVALVALVGITGALLALQLERAGELKLLQRIGLSHKEQRQLLLYEAGLLGCLAVLLAMPLGTLLAWMLCEVINQRAFGWHIEVRLLMEHYVLAAIVGLLATSLAGWLCVRTRSIEVPDVHSV